MPVSKVVYEFPLILDFSNFIMYWEERKKESKVYCASDCSRKLIHYEKDVEVLRKERKLVFTLDVAHIK